MDNKKKKQEPIGYSTEQRKSMKTLIERTQKDAGDYVGSGTVTEVPKKKKMKRMQMGGAAMSQRGTQPNERGAMPVRGRGPVGAALPDGTSNVRDYLQPNMGRDNKMIRPGMIERSNRMEGKVPGYSRGRANPNFAPVERPFGRGNIGGGKGSEYPGMPKVRPPGDVRTDPITGRPPIPFPRVGMNPPLQPRQGGYGMKGGGLARKGVGMALAKGGLVKANGCAARGKTKGKMV